MGGVLPYEVVGHDASSSIDDTSHLGLVFLSALTDGIFVEEFSVVVAGEDVEVVVVVGFLNAASGGCVVAGYGEMDA